MLRDFRKPLIIAAPKIGLKHPKSSSPLQYFAPNSKFTPTIAKDYHNISNIKKLVICSGKIAFDIEASLDKLQIENHGIRVVRLEEIAPFPVSDLRSHLKSLSKEDTTEIVYVQEESMN